MNSLESVGGLTSHLRDTLGMLASLHVKGNVSSEPLQRPLVVRTLSLYSGLLQSHKQTFVGLSPAFGASVSGKV